MLIDLVYKNEPADHFQLSNMFQNIYPLCECMNTTAMPGLFTFHVGNAFTLSEHIKG